MNKRDDDRMREAENRSNNMEADAVTDLSPRTAVLLGLGFVAAVFLLAYFTA